MRTRFNGFGSDETVNMSDEPMATLYGEGRRDVARNNVVQL
jgi:ornithine decarboxylase